MWIMIAGPYRSGANSEADREQNLANLNGAAYELFRKGHVPVVGVNCALPLIAAAGSDAFESIMMPLSLAMADRCDAVLRLRGFCPGADEEVEEDTQPGRRRVLLARGGSRCQLSRPTTQP